MWQQKTVAGFCFLRINASSFIQKNESVVKYDILGEVRGK